MHAHAPFPTVFCSTAVSSAVYKASWTWGMCNNVLLVRLHQIGTFKSGPCKHLLGDWLSFVALKVSKQIFNVSVFVP